MALENKNIRLASQISLLFSDILKIEIKKIDIQLLKKSELNFIIKVLKKKFFVIFRKTTSSASIADASRQLLQSFQLKKKSMIPVVVVPFMGDLGKKICETTGVNWLDLSGNGEIQAPGLRIRVDGRRNCFISRGRPANLFAPKSSRIIRYLLIHQEKKLTQQELVRSTDMDKGLVSRLVGRLEQEKFITRDTEGKINVIDPHLLLNSWRERYDFSQHQIIAGHILARSGMELLSHVNSILTSEKIVHVATGLCGAWLLNHFSNFRLTTLYLENEPSDELLHRLEFRKDPRGANIWFVIPNDVGVFQNIRKIEQIYCADPIQIYLDLKNLPERSQEAAEQLRSQFLKWS